MTEGSKIKKPCLSCKYFYACGESSRTQPCAERELRNRKKNTDKKY